MAQQIIGADGATVVKVDPTFGALRYTPRPLEASGWYQISAKSGAMAGTIAANSTCFSLRQINAATILLIRKVQVGWITTTGYTAAQFQDFALQVGRSWTVSDSAQTTITLSGNTNKLRTAFSSLTSVDCRISNTAGITAGTRTLDANWLGVYGAWCPITTVNAGFGLTTIFDQGPGDYPLVLAQNEGIIITNPTAIGAGGVGFLTVMVEVAETTAY